VVGIAVIVSITAAVAGSATLGTSSGPSTGVSWLKVALGVLLVLVGVRDWRHRPKGGHAPALPKWLTMVEAIGPAKAGGLGIVLSAVNPKNLLLLVAAGVSIAQATSSGGAEVASIVIFTVIGASTVALPVVLNAFIGHRAQQTLDDMNNWLKANNTTVMAVLFLVIGSVLIGKGIGGF
jgi:threonine/homoserine/homoserine lactone efflux protein